MIGVVKVLGITITSGGIAILVTAATGLVVGLGGLYFQWNSRGENKRGKQVLLEVRELANGTYSTLHKRCAQLERELAKHKLPIPEDPNV
jgi:hypothetical protein